MKEGQDSPGYHFTDEVLFAAFMETIPRKFLTAVISKSEILRKRHFRGFRITDSTPPTQHILKAFRKDDLDHHNRNLS